MLDGLDGALAGFVSELKRTEPADPRVVSRVVRAAAGEDRTRGRRSWFGRPRTLTVRSLLSLGAAAAIGGLVLGAALDAAARRSAAPAGVEYANAGPLQLPLVLYEASDGAGGERPVPVQFILVAPEAANVALVGDFNGWDPRAEPLRRDAAGIWSATVTLDPGRHAYAFMVDDSVWTPDPQAPGAEDADYGRPNSVIIVGGI